MCANAAGGKHAPTALDAAVAKSTTKIRILRSLTASKQPTTKTMGKNTKTTDSLAVDSASAGSLVATARRNMERCTMGSAGWWSAFDDLRRLENTEVSPSEVRTN